MAILVVELERRLERYGDRRDLILQLLRDPAVGEARLGDHDEQRRDLVAFGRLDARGGRRGVCGLEQPAVDLAKDRGRWIGVGREPGEEARQDRIGLHGGLPDCLPVLVEALAQG